MRACLLGTELAVSSTLAIILQLLPPGHHSTPDPLKVNQVTSFCSCHCRGHNLQPPTAHTGPHVVWPLTSLLAYLSPFDSLLSFECNKHFLASEPSEGAVSSSRTFFSQTFTWWTPHISDLDPHATLSESFCKYTL